MIPIAEFRAAYNRAYDIARDAWFRSQGFQSRRFWNGEVIERPRSVGEAILRAIGRG